MSDLAIRVDDLGKRYKIGAKQRSYETLRETLVDLAAAPVRRLAGAIRGRVPGRTETTMWALRNISFEVNRGEVVGIIGRNGAGKTTLLKILSRITKPTAGTVDLWGRVGSLLEIGTGFHPELTGRENIYLNAAILGMRRLEIDRKFDEIIAFSEIEAFLDTPIKHYSSGMHVRLAFAVAAHLEPQILLVDEVLAVGDVEFQRKCMGKMSDVAREGHTVVYVSHNLASIESLCPRTILIDSGRVVSDAPTAISMEKYLGQQRAVGRGEIDLSEEGTAVRRNSLASSRFRWKRARILNSNGDMTASIHLNEPFKIELQGRLTEGADDLRVGLGVRTSQGTVLFNTHSTDQNLRQNYQNGDVAFNITMDPNILAPGIYILDVGANGTGITDWIPDAIILTIEETDRDGRTIGRSNFSGVVLPRCEWFVEFQPLNPSEAATK